MTNTNTCPDCNQPCDDIEAHRELRCTNPGPEAEDWRDDPRYDDEDRIPGDGDVFPTEHVTLVLPAHSGRPGWKGRSGWQAQCNICGPVGRFEDYEADAQAIADRHHEIGGFER